jgi:hypothetical protein
VVEATQEWLRVESEVFGVLAEEETGVDPTRERLERLLVLLEGPQVGLTNTGGSGRLLQALAALVPRPPQSVPDIGRRSSRRGLRVRPDWTSGGTDRLSGAAERAQRASLGRFHVLGIELGAADGTREHRSRRLDGWGFRLHQHQLRA